MMGDDRSCLWDLYVVERVQLPAIALLADIAGGRVHRISPALLHRLERLRLDDMAEGNADEHARLQRLLQGMAVLLPKWGRRGVGCGFAARANAVADGGERRGEPIRVSPRVGR